MKRTFAAALVALAVTASPTATAQTAPLRYHFEFGLGATSTPVALDALHGTAPVFGGGIALALSRTLRAEVSIVHERYPHDRDAARSGGAREVRDGCCVTAALAGVEFGRARPGAASPFARAGAGIGCARVGVAHGSDLTGHAWTERSRAEFAPALAAGLGLRLPSGSAGLDLRVGVQGLALLGADGTTRSIAFSIGVGG